MARREKHRRAEAARREARSGYEGDLAVMDEAVQQSVAEHTADTDEQSIPEPTEYSRMIAIALGGKTTFFGPVPDHRFRGRNLSDEVIAHRRRRNRIAKRQRKINRPRRKRRGNLIALAWLAAAVLIIGGAAGLSVPRAQALTYGAPLHVVASWIGGDCWARTAVKPADSDARTLAPAFVPGCHDEAVDVQFVTRGQWFGIDPDVGDAYSVSCTVTNTATGVIVATDYARHGDGHNATCLGRWT